MEGNLICNKPDCDNPVSRINPFKLVGREPLYCSRGCVEWAYNEWKIKRKVPTKVLTAEQVDAILHPKEKEIPPVEDAAKEFGDAGVVRKFCDNPGCGRPVTLVWKGRNGEYCSNKCKELGENMTLTEDVTTDATTTAPITGSKKVAATPLKKAVKVAPAPPPAPAKKSAVAAKKAPVAPAKAAPTKKVAAKAAPVESNGSGRATSFDRDYIIRRTDTFKDCKSLQGSGTSTDRVKAIKDGMTVGEYLEALKKAGLPAGLGNLQMCERNGFVTVKAK